MRAIAKEGILLSDLRQQVRKRLKLGKRYKLDRTKIGDNRDDGLDIEKMTCIGIYSHFALFENAKGFKESFLYQELYKAMEKTSSQKILMSF